MSTTPKWRLDQRKESLLLELNTLTEQMKIAQEDSSPSEEVFIEQERIANEISILLKYIDNQEFTYTLEELGL